MPVRLLLLGALLAMGCAPTPPLKVTVKPTLTTPLVASTSAASTGIDFSNLDRTVNPCEDFYAYACGGWIKRTEIPADRSQWGAFGAIEEQNLALLRQILEDDAAGKGHPSDGYRDQLGRFWSSCVAEERIEATAPAELAAILAQVNHIDNINDFARALALLHLGVADALFGFGVQQDYKNSTEVIGVLDQGGLGLPDRDYYLENQAKFKEIRDQYQLYVTKMFELAGEPPALAVAAAQMVLRIETDLARASLARVDLRDPQKIYHRLNLAGIKAQTPSFPWELYLQELGHPGTSAINVAVPDFFAAVERMLHQYNWAAWRTYLRWHALNGVAPLLSRAFVDENFRFYGRVLNGQRELPPRWKLCVKATDRALGEALAQSFVRVAFGHESKGTTQEMVRAIEGAMRADLEQLAWMDAPTRGEALAKLHGIANKIGYPERWRNYEALGVMGDSYLANAVRASRFEYHRELKKIGQPLDRSEWSMTPPTVNAYYDSSLNEMVFPAGILQAPFFNLRARPAVNFGAIGMVMGHELTHGFDDEGRQFDAKGNLRDWWTPAVSQDFDQRAACIAKQYDGYVAIDALHLNGKLTLGENIADIGGIRLAYRAFLEYQRRVSSAPSVAGFSNEQLFFLGSAQAWCSKVRDENARLSVTIDPHSPPRFRVNGSLANLPEFAHAFSCQPGSKMVRAQPCSIW